MPAMAILEKSSFYQGRCDNMPHLKGFCIIDYLSPPRIKMITATMKRHIGKQKAIMIAFGIPIRL